MKLVTFRTEKGGERLGALIDGDAAVLDLAEAGGGKPAFASMQALIDGGSGALGEANRLVDTAPRGAVSALSSVKLAAPLPRPVKMRDCSLFLEHMEAGMKKVARQMADADPNPEAKHAELMASGRFTLNPLFKKKVIYYNCDRLAVSGPGDEIVWPSDSGWMDYELEWACIVGKPGKDIAPDKAREHIFGYTIFNDWSARDTQLAVMECNLGPGAGKDFARSNGLGPCIATPDEFDDPYKLTMTARVNGEEWSRGTTGSMHHSFEDAVSQFSRDRELTPGEIIGSGTVLSGCGLELGRRLSGGDTVELEIEGIGILSNRVVRRP
ncbi:MAG: fumarylacetoacetate hydrolase family protein [Parvibaculum sp.]|uniref:fumarylacetoacetate hydrolase family protein n=1 Tax=Parvibaculum sp. TaxID=2024848 RepID=UPI0025DDB599|nr:fumarylacetoacetate hydrolase family protein [Parvibaculum sp.]MCE9650105.1 fumarylacetoacetate hydrolase family protein [Parvibaculum sp.]